MDNPFAALAVDLYEQGATAEETYRQYARIESALGDASMAEQTELIPEWKIAVKVPDDTPSGYRYEYHTRASEDQQEAERNTQEATGFEVVSEKTEQIGYIEVACCTPLGLATVRTTRSRCRAASRSRSQWATSCSPASPSLTPR